MQFFDSLDRGILLRKTNFPPDVLESQNVVQQLHVIIWTDANDTNLRFGDGEFVIPPAPEGNLAEPRRMG